MGRDKSICVLSERRGISHRVMNELSSVCLLSCLLCSYLSQGCTVYLISCLHSTVPTPCQLSAHNCPFAFNGSSDVEKATLSSAACPRRPSRLASGSQPPKLGKFLTAHPVDRRQGRFTTTPPGHENSSGSRYAELGVHRNIVWVLFLFFLCWLSFSEPIGKQSVQAKGVAPAKRA